MAFDWDPGELSALHKDHGIVSTAAISLDGNVFPFACEFREGLFLVAGRRLEQVRDDAIYRLD